MRWRTANNHRRSREFRARCRGIYVVVKHGPTWADESASMAKIIADVAKAFALSRRLLEDVTVTLPVVTQCKVCRRPNPCPLHSFNDQMCHVMAEARR